MSEPRMVGCHWDIGFDPETRMVVVRVKVEGSTTGGTVGSVPLDAFREGVMKGPAHVAATFPEFADPAALHATFRRALEKIDALLAEGALRN